MTEPVIKCWYAFPYEVSDCNTVIMLSIWEEATRRTIFLSQEASKTAMVQKLWLLTRPGLITAHWGMSMESSLELGMSLPSTTRHRAMKCPQSIVKQVAVKGPCWLEVGTGQLPLQRWSWPLLAADLRHPLKGVQGGDQKQGTLCSGKNLEELAFRESSVFR